MLMAEPVNEHALYVRNDNALQLFFDGDRWRLTRGDFTGVEDLGQTNEIWVRKLNF